MGTGLLLTVTSRGIHAAGALPPAFGRPSNIGRSVRSGIVRTGDSGYAFGMAGTGGVSPSAVPTVPGPEAVALEATLACAARIRAYSWDRTPLRPLDGWDPALRAPVAIMLASQVLMALAYVHMF